MNASTVVTFRPTVNVPAYFLGRPGTMYLDRYARTRRYRPREW